MFKKLLFYAFIAFLAWKFFTTAEFGNFGFSKNNLQKVKLPAPKYALNCIEFLKNSAYDRAASCYKRELINDRNNPEIHYYLAYSYFQNKNYASAVFHTNYIMKNLQNSEYLNPAISLNSAAGSALQQKQILETTDTPDYYNEIKTPLRWGKMPINVWIEHSDNNFNLRNAFNTWQTALYPTISFRFVNRQEDAHISVIFDDPKKHCQAENAAGCTSVRVFANNQKRLYDARIYLAYWAYAGRRFSDNELYGVLCHEIGHALGITGGHSKNKSDVMYPSTDMYNTRPTRRDIRTIERIYGK